MPSERLTIEFPIGGLNRQLAYQNQPPYTTPDCLNVRARDVLTGRLRGGSRPGLSRAYVQELGGGQPVNMLATVRPVGGLSPGLFLDEFPGSALATQWVKINFVQAPDTIAVGSKEFVSGQFQGCAYVDNGGNLARKGAVRLTAIADLDTTKTYSIYADCIAEFTRPAAYPGGIHAFGKAYYVFFGMNNASPDAWQDGFIAWVEPANILTQTTFTVKLQQYSGGVGGAISSQVVTIPNNTEFALRVFVEWDGATHDVFVYMNSTLALTSLNRTFSGHRVGFGVEVDTQVPPYEITSCMIYRYRVFYIKTGVAEQFNGVLVAASNGIVYYENNAGAMIAVSHANLPVVNSTEPLHAVDRGGKLWIADHGELKASGSDGVIGSTNRLSAASIANWTTLGIGVNSHLCSVTNGASGTVDGTYAITSVTSGYIVLSPAPANGTCSFRVELGPKVFDPSTNTLAPWTAANGGNIPLGNPLIALNLDRVFLGGAATAPHVWYCSRVADPQDWDYSSDPGDVGRAVAGTDSPAGVIGQPLTAMSAYIDDYLVMASRHELWLHRGNPAGGGWIDNVSRSVGILSEGAWCHGPNGELFFMTRDGLYAMIPGSSAPTPISRTILPEELINIDVSTVRITMIYNVALRGIHIFLSQESSGISNAWFYDLDVPGFWPDSFDDDLRPMSVTSHEPVGTGERRALIGCFDGYIRYFDESAPSDDGEPIASYVVIGPVRLGVDDTSEGTLLQLVSRMATASGATTHGVIVAQSPELLPNAAVLHSLSASSGLNTTWHPRARGGALAIKVSATSTRWAMEGLVVTRKRGGRLRT